MLAVKFFFFLIILFFKVKAGEEIFQNSIPFPRSLPFLSSGPCEEDEECDEMWDNENHELKRGRHLFFPRSLDFFPPNFFSGDQNFADRDCMLHGTKRPLNAQQGPRIKKKRRVSLILDDTQRAQNRWAEQERRKQEYEKQSFFVYQRVFDFYSRLLERKQEEDAEQHRLRIKKIRSTIAILLEKNLPLGLLFLLMRHGIFEPFEVCRHLKFMYPLSILRIVKIGSALFYGTQMCTHCGWSIYFDEGMYASSCGHFVMHSNCFNGLLSSQRNLVCSECGCLVYCSSEDCA